MPFPHRIVIIGGGAGGLELATRLGRRLGPQHVTLVDQAAFHIWKPSLHEVAASTLDIHQEGLSYPMLAHDSGFTFVQGRLSGVDRDTRRVSVEALCDAQGQEIFPARTLPYDSLVIAVGSTTHFFGTPGAAEHAIALDSVAAAERFRLALLKGIGRTDQARARGEEAIFDIVIVGAGATGVELAAELHQTARAISIYGLAHYQPERDLRITLLEGGPRILGPLPDRVASAAHALLVQRGVHIETDCRVAAVHADAVQAADNRRFPADLCVWAAGIAAPPLLAALGLPVNAIGQLQTDARLHTADPAIYALGDCAAVPCGDGKTVPARAQAASQQAAWLADALSAQVLGRTPPTRDYQYHDRGSLVSVGHDSGVGSLMGNLVGGRFFVEGTLARLMYMSLHLMHHRVVLGFWRTASLALGRFLTKRSQARVKLH